MSSIALRSVSRLSRPLRTSFTGNARGLHLTHPRAKLYKNPDAKTFEQIVNAKDRIVLVDFYADWCRPCHQLSPVIEKLTEEPNKSGSGLPLDLIKVDIEGEDGGPLGASFKVSSLPTVLAFKEGERVDGFIGAQPEPIVKKLIESL
ncbi:thioredoxin-like protein [Coprinopsis sp. MPI-PUGE-AT-0042]|nr:thioredoxin-like protein [Coprinopsis sp. MPI-PUGE-AT-0042]